MILVVSVLTGWSKKTVWGVVHKEALALFALLRCMVRVDGFKIAPVRVLAQQFRRKDSFQRSELIKINLT